MTLEYPKSFLFRLGFPDIKTHDYHDIYLAKTRNDVNRMKEMKLFHLDVPMNIEEEERLFSG